MEVIDSISIFSVVFGKVIGIFVFYLLMDIKGQIWA